MAKRTRELVCILRFWWRKIERRRQESNLWGTQLQNQWCLQQNGEDQIWTRSRNLDQIGQVVEEKEHEAYMQECIKNENIGDAVPELWTRNYFGFPSLNYGTFFSKFCEHYFC